MEGIHDRVCALHACPEPPEPHEGRRARYETLRTLGSGGMATVHLARREDTLGRTRLVALKRLHGFLLDDPNNVSTLRQEARIGACVRHPNVVGVVDLLEDDRGGAPVMVMEWVDGVSLSAVIAAFAKSERGLPIDVAVAIVRDVLEGLEAAHVATDDGEEIGIVHRDVSPQNILVGFDGRARIADFGAATVRPSPDDVEAGAVTGKLGYMAPEQLEGRADRRTDLFAVGVVLWELLTGRPFRDAADQGVQVLVQILRGQVPPPSHLAPGARDLDDLVMRAVRQSPEDRFATAREMADALVLGVVPASPGRVAEVLRDVLPAGAADARLAA